MRGEFIYSAALMAVTILHVGRRKDFDNGPMESTWYPYARANEELLRTP